MYFVVFTYLSKIFSKGNIIFKDLKEFFTGLQKNIKKSIENFHNNDNTSVLEKDFKDQSHVTPLSDA